MSYKFKHVHAEDISKHSDKLRNISQDPQFLQIYEKLGIPPPSRNGGWYTGEPFHENAPYANIPIIPDTGYINHFVMRAAEPAPPEEALYHYPTSFRPGNNTPIMPGVQKYKEGKYGILCQNAPREKNNILKKPCRCPKCNCSKYYYL